MYFAYKRSLEINRAYKYKAAPTPSAELTIIGKHSEREIRPLSEDGDVSKACFQAALLFSGVYCPFGRVSLRTVHTGTPQRKCLGL